MQCRNRNTKWILTIAGWGLDIETERQELVELINTILIKMILKICKNYKIYLFEFKVCQYF